jgi:hypothetical protein
MRSVDRVEEERRRAGPTPNLTQFVNDYETTCGRAVRPFVLTISDLPPRGRVFA